MPAVESAWLGLTEQARTGGRDRTNCRFEKIEIEYHAYVLVLVQLVRTLSCSRCNCAKPVSKTSTAQASNRTYKLSLFNMGMHAGHTLYANHNVYLAPGNHANESIKKRITVEIRKTIEQTILLVLRCVYRYNMRSIIIVDSIPRKWLHQ